MASAKPINARLGTGCFVLLALPFAGFGLFALLQACKEIFANKWRTGLPLLAFALVFCAVGFGLMAVGFFGRRKVREQQALEARHPNEPWLWREDWMRGEMKS